MILINSAKLFRENVKFRKLDHKLVSRVIERHEKVPLLSYSIRIYNCYVDENSSQSCHKGKKRHVYMVGILVTYNRNEANVIFLIVFMHIFIVNIIENLIYWTSK
jgi:hypothetical protein